MLKVGLGRNSFAPGIAVITNLVEDIFEFIFVVAPTSEICQVDHGTESDIVVILVVCAMAEIVASIISNIIDTEEIVQHVLIRSVFIGVVGGGDQP